MYLAVFLTGNVQGVLGNLPLNEQHNYDVLCTALQQRFAPTKQTKQNCKQNLILGEKTIDSGARVRARRSQADI